MSWAVCPVCHAVVADAAGHADWHNLTVAAEESLSGTPAPTVEKGRNWPDGTPVPFPAPPDPEWLAALRAQALPWFPAGHNTLSLLETFLAAPPASVEEVAARQRVLAESVKGALTAIRSLTALQLRTQEDQ